MMTVIRVHIAELSETDGVHKIVVYGLLQFVLWLVLFLFFHTRLQFLLFVGMFELYLKV